MNNIEILEEYLKKLKLTPEELLKSDETIIFIEYKEIQAIENLIQENKKLLTELQENMCIKDIFKPLYIPKSKVKEKIEELEKQEDWFIENKGLDELYGQIDILKELLKGE